MKKQSLVVLAVLGLAVLAGAEVIWNAANVFSRNVEVSATTPVVYEFSPAAGTVSMINNGTNVLLFAKNCSAGDFATLVASNNCGRLPAGKTVTIEGTSISVLRLQAAANTNNVDLLAY